MNLLLSLAYVPTVLAGFLASGGLDGPVADPYLALRELLLMVMVIPLVLLLASVHSYASPDRTGLSLAALAWVVLASGLTVGVHFVLLTMGRESSTGLAW